MACKNEEAKVNSDRNHPKVTTEETNILQQNTSIATEETNILQQNTSIMMFEDIKESRSTLNTKRVKEQVGAKTSNNPFTDSIIPKENTLELRLSSLKLKKRDIEFVINQGEKFLDKPLLLSKKLKIPLDTAKMAIEALRSFKQEPEVVSISKVDSKKIAACLKENPEFVDKEDIALFCEIDEAIVAAYLEPIPLTKEQQDNIKQKFTAGYSVNDIINIVKLSNKKVQEYVSNTFLTFLGEEGQRCWKILDKYFPASSSSEIRLKVISNNLKLQNLICCILPERNQKEYLELKNYFGKFEESKSFFQINLNLTIQEIILIQKSSSDTLEQLSIKLNKVETVIRNYLEQYHPNKIEKEYYKELQREQIQLIKNNFGEDKLTFHTYRMIISNSFENMIREADTPGKIPKDVFREILPLAFYYLKCSLPLEDITTIIANASKITLTTQEVFHIIFQLSDPVLRGFAIEHYSFSNPVPLYYPDIHTSLLKGSGPKFEICKELWYSMQPFNGLVSFGIGKAGWNPIGKSFLLDSIFDTDFVKGSSQNSAFHLNSIDIQMTKNLFGEMKDKTSSESTKWAYIDCHGHSNLDIIQVICQHLDIVLIHINYQDYIKNRESLNKDIHQLTETVKHVYLLIRDYTESEVRIISNESKYQKSIFIPNLISKDTKIHSVTKSLKEIGYEILHLKVDPSKNIGSEFLVRVMNDLKYTYLNEIQKDKQLIQEMTNYIGNVARSSNTIDFSFLNFYPIFVEYMSCYHKASYETDQRIIDQLNANRGELDQKLKRNKMGDVVMKFNEILKQKNSTLIMWKLSQELSLLSKKIISMNLTVDKVIEQKNDKYTLEILWRESLLSNKYGNLSEEARDTYNHTFAANFSNHVERGEAFELIDGDNLRYFNQDIDSLLYDLYERQNVELAKINKGKSISMKQAPIVVSIFGPQSSGKSTLLNYCFGCKFLTSAGRCTRGIYGSLSRLSRPVNNSSHFLILDTEGLDAIERGNIQDTSLIHFDRTMVLFCLAVSQVVIINVKGDIGNEMQNLLQICAYSLNKLKVSKVAAPKVFFVLNQQADPDPDKHLDSINILLEKLNKESDLMDTEGIKISDLIHVSRENLFILPSAFNSQQINRPNAKLFDSEVTKLSPTITFANKCANLRLAIIDQLDNMPLDERQPFTTMSEWMEMSGVIWDTIIKYKDIVKYRNIEELMCSNLLQRIVSDLMKDHIYCNKELFQRNTDNLILEINDIDTLGHPNTILTKIMFKFDEIFNKYQENLAEFASKCQNDNNLKKLNHICDESKLNLSRLIYMERKHYEDKLRYQIKAVLIEIKLSESMTKFQEAITKNVDSYLNLSVEEQKIAFNDMWQECFGADDIKEEEIERDENFDNLYSVFKMEAKAMENKSTIFDLFRNLKFVMNEIILTIKRDMLARFQNDPTSFTRTEQFIYRSDINSPPIKDMTPYPGKSEYYYLGNESLIVMKEETHYLIWSKSKPSIHKWIPKGCRPIVKYCSGYFNHPDIIYKMDLNSQILLLTSRLKDPNNPTKSLWERFVTNISTEVMVFIDKDPNISPATVKEIINYLYSLLKIVNYEINFIQAKLSNTAERTISTFVFAYAFRSLWTMKSKKRKESNVKQDKKKMSLLQYFLQKIENRKMVRGKWDHEKMKESDHKMSQKFASDFLLSIQRGIETGEQPIIEAQFKEQSGNLSHNSILLSANERITNELTKADESIDTDNFIVQYICNRNEVLKNLFQSQWEIIEEELYHEIVKNMNLKFLKQIGAIKQILTDFLSDLNTSVSEQKAFDSDNNFEMADLQACKDKDPELLIKARESPFKAMLTYFRMYLDPKVDEVQIKKSDTYILCDKPTNPANILDEDAFKRLNNTKMFNSENIFNISEYITQFLSVLNCYKYEITKADFREMVKDIKEEFEKNVIGCPAQCPSCGKLCEREIHPNDGNCQIKTGHQICSMGGKVWNSDAESTAVLFMCDDYKDHTKVILPGQRMNWGEFKEKCGNEWDWTLPKDEKYVTYQQNNREKMKNIWNKFGRGILKYYEDKGTKIKYIPYISSDDVYKTLFSIKYYICFVIDGTGSMETDIERARISVGQFINLYKERGSETEFKVVIYRDHCDSNIIEIFPSGNKFTSQHKTIQNFLETVKADGGGDYPEAVLDGLATAATQCDWENKLGTRNIIIHIYDAPPHGDFPNYESHYSDSSTGNCCCCNHGTLCHFDWKRDVWDNMHKFQIQYHGISTDGDLPNFEAEMKVKLGDLCGKFQVVGKEQVNDAVLKIFIKYKMD